MSNVREGFVLASMGMSGLIMLLCWVLGSEFGEFD